MVHALSKLPLTDTMARLTMNRLARKNSSQKSLSNGAVPIRKGDLTLEPESPLSYVYYCHPTIEMFYSFGSYLLEERA